MDDHGNKTIMCSVLFLDIVEYSKKTVSEQIYLKDGFNSILSHAIREVSVDDRIILDTGDGAAVSFLGDVEDALKVALNVRAGLLNEGLSMSPPLRVRMGINIGPVRLVKDINGQPNIMGDGINVALRVMKFANDGQIFVTRSYFDAVSRLSQDYAKMFHHEGLRTDKHVREHEIYAIGYPGEITVARQKLVGQGKSPGMLAILTGDAKAGWEAAAKWLGDGARGFPEASIQQRALFVGVLLIPLLLVLLVVKVAHRPSAPVPQAVTETVIVPAAPVVSEVAAIPARVDESAALEKVSEVAHPALVAAKPEIMEQVKTSEPISSIPAPEQTTAVEPSVKASVEVAVSPWGEVYLDGRMRGVSPPLTELQVAPGKHELAIRNTTFPAYTQHIEIKAGERIKIKHKFAN